MITRYLYFVFLLFYRTNDFLHYAQDKKSKDKIRFDSHTGSSIYWASG